MSVAADLREGTISQFDLSERDGNGDGNDGNQPPTPAHPEHRPTMPDID
jgi:hypothetical protein